MGVAAVWHFQQLVDLSQSAACRCCLATGFGPRDARRPVPRDRDDDAHHLSEAMRDGLRALGSLKLPLLPEHELHPAPEAGDALANSTYGGYFDKAGCLVCHVDPSTTPGPSSVSV